MLLQNSAHTTYKNRGGTVKINALIKMEHYALIERLYNDGQTPDYSHPELMYGTFSG